MIIAADANTRRAGASGDHPSGEHSARKGPKPETDLGVVDRPETLAEQAYANIKTALMNGLLAPGEAVSVRRIAATFAISLTPAREALMRLAAERALDVDPRRTFSVPVLNRRSYVELLTIRLMLEGHATEVAATEMKAAKIDQLVAINARFSDAIDRDALKQSLELNRLFHFTIYQAAGMPDLFGLIEGLWLRVGPVFNLLYPDYQRAGRGRNNHLEAIGAIRARAAPRARAAIEQDLNQGAEYILQLLDQ
ncbi:MAG: GntR family transcriptional regulator [Kiloniellales bacterium]|nr:GntR family transcriptional regulator [Kiloniellales bacterium]